MKRFVTVLLAVLLLASLVALPADAKGYSLSIPSSVSAHNLEAYGLHTMNVYQTITPPTVDGSVGDGEYPGPNNGCSLCSVPGDNLWMSSFAPSSDPSKPSQTAYNGNLDFTPYINEEDFPDYIKSYLTYDDQFFYYAVSTVVPALRDTSGTDKTAGRSSGNWWTDVKLNFLQSDVISEVHANSVANTRHNMKKNPNGTLSTNTIVNETSSRVVALQSKDQYFKVAYPNYVDELGTTWGGATYKRAENYTYRVEVLQSGKWRITMEGRFLLGDVLRVTDVEYEDGSPLDYVPEWGVWGISFLMQTYHAVDDVTPDGTPVKLDEEDVIYATSYLPAQGLGTSGTGALLKNTSANDGSMILFNNTVSAAVSSGHGRTVSYLLNPVHYLGIYDPSFDQSGGYQAMYSQKPNTLLASTTTRVTRTRPRVLTSGVRGVNNRVIGVATRASGATGDSITWTIVMAVAMLVCATAAVFTVVWMKRSAKQKQK